MLKIDYTKETVFGFEGPNLCLLGNENDFQKIGKAILNLTDPYESHSIEITDLDFIEIAGEHIRLVFASKKGAGTLGKVSNNGDTLIFELDDRYWERIFVFFALMSWDKKTYYLNSFEDALKDLPLVQEVHFICSSEF